MAVTAFWYARAILSLANKEIDLIGTVDDLYVMLTTSTYTPNQDTHDYKDDVTNEISGTAYVANGYQLVTEAFTQANNVITLDADDPSWATATFTTRRAVYYDRTPASDATRPLLSWVDFGGDETVSAATFTIQHHASQGIGQFTATDATGFP